MKAKLAIPPPEDWIQFEIVCKKVWGVLWNIPNEIEFNSTNSQGQDGVDLVGIPQGERNYHGIQCKNKRLHLKTGIKNKITTSLIDEEIKKALDFKPSLNHLIIATSLYKDKEIEEHIRSINLQHIKDSIFTVQICFWEYIAEKIQENQNLCNWYLGQRDYVYSHKVEILLNNGEKSKSFQPTFIREKRIYRHQTAAEEREEIEKVAAAFADFKDYKWSIPWSLQLKQLLLSPFRRAKRIKDSDLAKVTLLVNGKPLEREYPTPAKLPRTIRQQPSYEVYQGFYFGLLIKNIGANVIEDYKLSFSLEGDFEEFDVESIPLTQLFNKNYPRHSWKSGDKCGSIEPEKNFLIQNDEFESRNFYIYPRKDIPTEIFIKWTLLARDYSEKGTLSLKIDPTYKEEETVWYIHPDDHPHEEIRYHNLRRDGPQPFNIS